MTEVCRPIPRYLEDNSFFHHAVHVARGFLGLCWKQFAGAFRLKPSYIYAVRCMYMVRMFFSLPKS